MGQSTPSPAFDPAREGTPELLWEAALERAPVLELPCTAIVVVSPHPDDEVLGAGGLISIAARTGHEVTVLSVTDGEAAYPDWAGLDEVRRREVRDALSVLAPFKLTIRRVSIPDGRVGRHRATLFEAIARCTSGSPLLVAPYEGDGHPDHDAAGEVGLEIAELHGLTLWRYPIWTWHHGTPDRLADRRWGRFPLDPAALDKKTRAISCFASQLRPSGRDPIVPDHVLPYFTRSYEAYLT
jgi:LmbE family N-acetylglucosaminyl deacetylase